MMKAEFQNSLIRKNLKKIITIFKSNKINNKIKVNNLEKLNTLYKIKKKTTKILLYKINQWLL